MDPNTVWQGAGKVELGGLRITGQAPQEACNGVAYMPLALPAGIAASDDPMLHARTAASALSLSRRLPGRLAPVRRPVRAARRATARDAGPADTAKD